MPEGRASARQIRIAQCGAHQSQFPAAAAVTHRATVVQIHARFDAVDDEPRLRGTDWVGCQSIIGHDLLRN